MRIKRICPICGTEFEVRVHNQVYCCKDCKRKRDNSVKRIKPRVVKKCLCCNEDFTPKRTSEKYCNNCKVLHRKEYQQKYREENKERLEEQKKEWYNRNIKQKKLYDKERYQRNRDKVLENNREYRRTHAKEIKERCEKYKPKRNKRLRERYKNDPEYRVEQRTKSMLKQQLKIKSDRTHKILGYSSKELMNHLEPQFYGDISWDNMDTWDIHHIIPINEWRLLNDDGTTNIEEVRKANALENLMPLKKKHHYKVTAIYNSERKVLTKDEICDIIKIELKGEQSEG